MDTPLNPSSREVLRDLLSEMPGYGSEFVGTFANHAPMVLVAQARMGASGYQLRRFFENYKGYKGLLPFKPSLLSIDEANWRDHLGERQHEDAYRRFFADEFRCRGRAELLHRWLPLLAPGVGSSAFHALMRVAYAVLNDDDTEVVNGLAYWCACWLQMPMPTGAQPLSSEPGEVLVHAGSVPAAKGQPIHALIWQNMQQSFALPGFETAGDWLAIDEDTMARCANAALSLFAATQDFCALHAVTGLHWIRVLAPFHEATSEMVRYFWAGVGALMNEMGYPSLPAPEAVQAWRDLPCPSWPEIFAAACQSFDEHDLSLVFSCSQEEAAYGDPLYRRAAARRLGMIKEMVAL